MNPKIIQLSVRVFGTIFGLAGVWFILTSLLALISISLVGPLPARGWAIFWLLFGAPLARAGYLAWFRWSPLAIRHVVGDLFFFAMLFFFYVLHFYFLTDWGFYCFIASIFVCYVFYRYISVVLSRRAFPTAPVTAATPE